jgi:hypothetical protein
MVLPTQPKLSYYCILHNRDRGQVKHAGIAYSIHVWHAYNRGDESWIRVIIIVLQCGAAARRVNHTTYLYIYKIKLGLVTLFFFRRVGVWHLILLVSLEETVKHPGLVERLRIVSAGLSFSLLLWYCHSEVNILSHSNSCILRRKLFKIIKELFSAWFKFSVI